MQIIGLTLLAFVVWYGFADRGEATISAFDPHAFIMVLGGSMSAIMASSSAQTTIRTFGALREALPGLGTLKPGTAALEAEREQLATLWREGRLAQAVELAERSRFPALQRMLSLVLERAPDEATRAAFTELQHATLSRWQPATGNWELLAKLAPSFGMVGTITGMIQLFKNMGAEGSDRVLPSRSPCSRPCTGWPSARALPAPSVTTCATSSTSAWGHSSAVSRRSTSSWPGLAAREPASEASQLRERRGLAAVVCRPHHQPAGLLRHDAGGSRDQPGQDAADPRGHLGHRAARQPVEHPRGDRGPSRGRGAQRARVHRAHRRRPQALPQLRPRLRLGERCRPGGAADPLNSMLATLTPYADKYGFAVEGHTDSTPVAPGGAYRSNWELSTDRANAVRGLLDTVGVPEDRIRVEGYADTVPLSEDQLEGLTPDEQLARHRRVIVRIY